jgi:hypothetical protein
MTAMPIQIDPFWTSAEIERAQSIRRMRRLWAACPPDEQWQLECKVYRLRESMAERDIAEHIEMVLEVKRPWRMSDAKLGRHLKAIAAGRRLVGLEPRRSMAPSQAPAVTVVVREFA